jgi:hypothetical protein
MWELVRTLAKVNLGRQAEGSRNDGGRGGRGGGAS